MSSCAAACPWRGSSAQPERGRRQPFIIWWAWAEPRGRRSGGAGFCPARGVSDPITLCQDVTVSSKTQANKAGGYPQTGRTEQNTPMAPCAKGNIRGPLPRTSAGNTTGGGTCTISLRGTVDRASVGDAPIISLSRRFAAMMSAGLPSLLHRDAELPAPSFQQLRGKAMWEMTSRRIPPGRLQSPTPSSP